MRIDMDQEPVLPTNAQWLAVSVSRFMPVWTLAETNWFDVRQTGAGSGFYADTGPDAG